MNAFSTLSDWLTGGDPGYMRLFSCMRQDYFWIILTVLLDLTVAAGYIVIALHWWKNERSLPPVPAKRALGEMRNIFLFCGICGYIFIPIKMFWPAWRLYDLFMMVLAYYTWRYACSATKLTVIYSELGRSSRLAADLEQSRKETAEKLFFLNAISHDLRTPLNGLILHANLAEMVASANDPATLKDALAEIKTSALGASRMLDSFLEYAQVAVATAPGELTAFELDAAVQHVVEKFRQSADGKSIALSVTIPHGMQVRLDRFKLERVLSNLLDNALKFTQRGSVRVEAQTDGKGLEIHVHDTGSGIAPEHQPKLFDEFFQVDNRARDRAKGFGMGLAIARGLARQLGGDLTVTSALGHGSRFTIALPNAIAGGNGQAAGTTAPTAAAAIAG